LWQTSADLPRWTWLQLRHGAPETLLHFGVAVGDDLLCTTVARELKKRGRGAIWMMSNHPALFEGNPDIERVLPVDPSYERFAVAHQCHFPALEYAPIDEQRERSAPPTRHIIAELCLRAGIQGAIEARPYLHLSDDERGRAAWASGMIAVQSSGLSARWPMRNKEWFPDRMQQVVDALARDFSLVQIGARGDPVLQNVVDLRGKTSVRELAAVFSQCRLYIGNVGFPMHLARAAECPAVIIFGGREAPWQSGYTANTNLHSPLPCAPCWLWNTCAFDRACMKQIEAAHVIEAARNQLATPRGPLAVDVLTL
jgi:hypothetical protein